MLAPPASSLLTASKGRTPLSTSEPRHEDFYTFWPLFAVLLMKTSENAIARYCLGQKRVKFTLPHSLINGPKTLNMKQFLIEEITS